MCRFGELSQQRVVPHSWHVRRCTQRDPIFTHSSHSYFSACRTVVTAFRWLHGPDIGPPVNGRLTTHSLRASAAGTPRDLLGGDPEHRTKARSLRSGWQCKSNSL